MAKYEKKYKMQTEQKSEAAQNVPPAGSPHTTPSPEPIPLSASVSSDVKFEYHPPLSQSQTKTKNWIHRRMEKTKKYWDSADWALEKSEKK